MINSPIIMEHVSWFDSNKGDFPGEGEYVMLWHPLGEPIMDVTYDHEKRQWCMDGLNMDLPSTYHWWAPALDGPEPTNRRNSFMVTHYEKVNS